jgi:hypothetical protein
MRVQFLSPYEYTVLTAEGREVRHCDPGHIHTLPDDVAAELIRRRFCRSVGGDTPCAADDTPRHARTVDDGPVYEV